MKSHITKVVAMLMAVLMLISLVPAAALPDLTLPDLQSVTVDSNTDGDNTSADSSEEKVPADDNVASEDGLLTEEEIAALEDAQVSEEELFEEAVSSVVLGKDVVVNDTEYYANNYGEADDFTNPIPADENTSPYEPAKTNNEDDPFLPGGKAWINLDVIQYGSPATPTIAFSEWSANTTFQNTSGVYYKDDLASTPEDDTLNVEYYIFPDVDLIDENLWGQTKKSADANNITLTTDNYTYPNATNPRYNGDNAEGFAYNRYDPMQGKWGVTFDVDRTYTSWEVDKYVDLTKNSHLMFSTEQVDGVKMAIAVEIGTPIGDTNDDGKMDYEYRWYTVTDDNPHPNVNADHGQEGYTQIPDIQISTVGAAQPLFTADSYTDNALCAAIDMTAWLPFVQVPEDDNVSYEDGVDFKSYHVRNVAVSTPAENSQASRINYLYFICNATAFMAPQANTGGANMADSTALLHGVFGEYGADGFNAADDDQNGWQGSNYFTVKYYSDRSGTFNTKDVDAEYVRSDGNQFVAVTMPIRKWVNVAKDGRRFNFTLETYDTTNTARPTISIWGNNQGYIDTTAQDAFGIYNNEECLFVAGGYDTNLTTEMPYLINSNDQKLASVDFNGVYNHYMKYTDHDGNSNWYDLAYSAGVKDNMVTEYTEDGTAENPNMYGWIYISAVRLVLPVGAMYRYDYGNLTPNSASLNATTVADGGMGVEPNVELDTYEATSAAYGPLLADSDGFDSLNLLTDASADNKVYGKLATVDGTYGANGVQNGVYLHSTIKTANTDYYGGGNAKLIPNGSRVIIYARARYTNGSTTYYYANYNGDYGWLSSYGAKVTFLKHQDTHDCGYLLSDYDSGSRLMTVDGVQYYIVDAGTHEVSMGWYQFKMLYTLWNDDSTCASTGDAADVATNTYGIYQCDGYAEVDSSWYIPANGGQRTIGHVLNDKRDANNQYKKHIDMVSGDYLRLRFKIEEGWDPVHNVAIAFKVTMNGTSDYYYVAPDGGTNADGTKTVKLVRDYTDVEDIRFTASTGENGSYSCYIAVDDFLSAYGNGATTATFEEVEIQICEYNFVTIDIDAYCPSDLRNDIEFAEDKDGNILIGESYNVFADAFNGRKVHGADRTDTLISNEMMESFSGGNGGYVYKDFTGTTGYDSNGWKLQYMSAHEAMHAEYLFPRLDPAVGCFSYSASNTWGHILFSRDDTMRTDEYSYLYMSGAIRDNVDKLGVAEDQSRMILFIVDGDGYIWCYNKATAKFVKLNETYKYDTYEFTSNADINTYGMPAMNIAADLTTSGISTIKSIGVFYNSVNADGTRDKAHDIHLNYCYLSTTMASEGYKETVAEREHVHHYYMMDNNPGRYATRFPVFNNPTGKIYTDADRVNPLKITRGDFFYDGTFYNGLPLDNMCKLNANGSLYTDANGQWVEIYSDRTKGLEAVWFFANYSRQDLSYDQSDDAVNALREILQVISYYYQFDPADDGITTMTEKSGDGKVFQTVWGYSRWPNYGNNQYDGNSQIFAFYKAGSSTGSMGTIPTMYATNNNCLVRSGLQTVKFETTFITGGGQMNYKGSAGIANGVVANTDNRYITESSLMGYYNWPKDVTANVVTPVRYGYTFDGWFTIPDTSDTAAETSLDKRIYRFHTKENTGADTFYAHWTKKAADTDATYGYDGATSAGTTWGELVNTLTFKDLKGNDIFTEREQAKYSNDFTVKIPNAMVMYKEDGTRIGISGWAIDSNNDGKYDPDVEGASSRYTVFTAGQSVTVTGNITLVPVPAANVNEDGEIISSTDDPVRVKIQLNGATLQALTKSGVYVDITGANADARYISVIPDEENGIYTYHNVPLNLVLRAVPLTVETDYGWAIENEQDKALQVHDDKSCIVSTNSEYYDFVAYTDMDITYSAAFNSTSVDENGVLITSYPDVKLSGSQIQAYWQYYLPKENPAGHKIQLIEIGTLYVSDKYYDQSGTPGQVKATWEVDGVNGSKVTQTNDYRNVDVVKVAAANGGEISKLPASMGADGLPVTNSKQQYYWMWTNKKTDNITVYTRGYIVYWIDLNDDGIVQGESNTLGVQSEVIITYSNYVTQTVVPGVNG